MTVGNTPAGSAPQTAVRCIYGDAIEALLKRITRIYAKRETQPKNHASEMNDYFPTEWESMGQREWPDKCLRK